MYVGPANGCLTVNVTKRKILIALSSDLVQ